MSDELRPEEQILSKIAEIGLANQLDSSEIDVAVRTDLIEMVQGQLDSVSLTGKDLVTQQQLHVQDVELHTGAIELNPLTALFGKLELNQLGRIVGW